jgi:hypothetical protein
MYIVYLLKNPKTGLKKEALTSIHNQQEKLSGQGMAGLAIPLRFIDTFPTI